MMDKKLQDQLAAIHSKGKTKTKVQVSVETMTSNVLEAVETWKKRVIEHFANMTREDIAVAVMSGRELDRLDHMEIEHNSALDWLKSKSAYHYFIRQAKSNVNYSFTKLGNTIDEFVLNIPHHEPRTVYITETEDKFEDINSILLTITDLDPEGFIIIGKTYYALVDVVADTSQTGWCDCVYLGRYEAVSKLEFDKRYYVHAAQIRERVENMRQKNDD